jgi:hypothetical protein
MKNENYIVIQGWMVNELGLSGNELLCYALIYGFSQDGESCFKGSRKYIAQLLGVSSLNTVDKILANLIEKSLLIKESNTVNGVTFNSYKANNITSSKNEYPTQNLSTPYSKFEHYNNSNNNSNKEEEIDKSISKKKQTELFSLFEEFVKQYKQLYGRHKGGNAKTLFSEFTKRHKDWESVVPLLLNALNKENEHRTNAKHNNEFFPEPKMLSTYLGKQRAWEAWCDDENTLFEQTNNDTLIINGVCYK